jgi:hypothetical protein
MGGFSATAAYTINPTVEAGADGGLVMLNFASGPVAARFQVAANNSSNAGRPSGYGLAASYDLGVAKVFATAMNGKAAVGTTATIIDRSGSSLSVQVPLGAVTLRGGVLNHSNDTTANVLDRRSFGADYALSKRTTIGADIFKNEGVTAGQANGNGFTVRARHTF